ncbi:MAG: YqaJ viral recombinase family protein [Gammaproteobacteria bacterium]|jgi:putative phage-type endonuclease|nr:YqaJ viral recombinase family protein [Gammaproteobacteria bacterium]
MIQGDADWFAARAGKFTGSRFSDLMARTKSGPSTSRANLLATLAVERLTGMCVETYTNGAMQRGTELEPFARAAYEAYIGDLVQEVAWVPHPTLDYAGVSPDGFAGNDGLVEIKCPSAMAKHLAALRSGDHATEYRWQIQGQIWVCEKAWCDATSYDPRYPQGLQLAITRVERDEKAIAELEAACIEANEEVNAMVSELQQMRGAA